MPIKEMSQMGTNGVIKMNCIVKEKNRKLKINFSFSIVNLQKCPSHSLNYMLLFYLFISCFSIASTSSVQLPESELSIRHKLLDNVQHRRFLRSPYLPPSVIGRQPSKRSNDSDTYNVIVKSSLENLHPPIVLSQSTSRSSAKSHMKAKIDELDSYGYEKLMTSYVFPRPPMVVDSSVLDSSINTAMQVNDDDEELLIRLQNDQSDQSIDSESEGTKSQGDVNQNKRFEKDSPKSKDKSSKRLMKFVDFSQVLNTINMTNGELEALLKRKNIAFNDFLEFIENGASEEQILKLLESPKHPLTAIPDSKPNWKSKAPLKKFQSTDDGNSKMFSKGLTELPFTEIVHQVPFQDGKQFDINHQSNRKETAGDVKHKKTPNSKKWSRSPKTKEVVDKENFNNQPWDYDSELDYHLPPKDSPIITHFHPSRTKNKTQISASILSVSVEQKAKPKKENIASEQHHFRVRNKIASTESVKVESSSLPRISSEEDIKKTKVVNPLSSNQYQDTQYVRQQLRLVFPMRGIVIFCGILGIIAFVTILVLVIYGTLKCNDNPLTPKTYKVKEQKDIEVTVT